MADISDKDEQKYVSESGIPIKVMYDASDLTSWDSAAALGKAGAFPFTRGVHADMYRGKIWTMRQYAGFATAEESNQRYKYLLSQGQTGLSVALDLPTQLGYDSDNPLVEDEVGRIGVAIDTLDDMERLFDEIPLDRVSTSFTINSTAMVILAMYLSVAQRRGISLAAIRGTTQNDMIKEYLARNTYIFPIPDSLRLSVDIIEFCAQYAPRWNPINIAGYHIRELGGDAIQELATVMGAAAVVVEETLNRGIAIDSFAPRISFELWTGQDFFEEIAKYRAARRMWAKLVKERFGAANAKSMLFRVFAGGNGITLTSKEPYNNLVRVTLQCLTAVLGGAQAVHAPAFDEAIAIPSQESALLALRTQQIIAYETGIINTADPLGGSYYLETLTDELEQRASQLLCQIDNGGGLVKAISEGTIQRDVQKKAYDTEQSIQLGRKSVVGVNKFDQGQPNESIPIQTVDPQVIARQQNRLREIKRTRDNRRVSQVLEQIRIAAAGKTNLMPLVMEAVQAYATVGEITDVLKNVFGEYKEPAIF